MPRGQRGTNIGYVCELATLLVVLFVAPSEAVLHPDIELHFAWFGLSQDFKFS